MFKPTTEEKPSIDECIREMHQVLSVYETALAKICLKPKSYFTPPEGHSIQIKIQKTGSLHILGDFHEQELKDIANGFKKRIETLQKIKNQSEITLQDLEHLLQYQLLNQIPRIREYKKLSTTSPRP